MPVSEFNNLDTVSGGTPFASNYYLAKLKTLALS